MTDPQHAKTVARWLFSLASACSSGGPIADLEAKVRQFTPWLADDFPDSATFTDASVKAVATEVVYWPPYGKLKDFLAAWWQGHRPATPGPAFTPEESADLESAELSSVDKHMARKWLSALNMPGNRTAVGDWVAAAWPGDVVQAPVLGSTTPALVVDLSLLRRWQPAAYRWLLRHSQPAAHIATKQRWTEREARREGPTAEELAAVAERVGTLTDATGKVRVGDGGPRRPDSNHAAAAKRYADQVETERGRKIGQLSREALDKAWAGSGLQRPQVPDAPPPTPPPAQEAAE
jgi:hypothetical protein